MMQENDQFKELPQVETCGDLIRAFHLSGRFSSNGMGASPLSWQEIDAFCKRSLQDLDRWDCEQIRAMSVAYCSAMHEYSEPSAPPPYIPEGLDLAVANSNRVNANLLAARAQRQAILAP